LDEGRHLNNVHALSYFLQLHLVGRFFSSDAPLRLVSLVWAGIGLAAMSLWLVDECVPIRARQATILLLALNPFFWQYAIQVRFYALFFAATILAAWRFRCWQQNPNRRNVSLLLASLVLLCTSHLFGWLVVAAGVAAYVICLLSRRTLIIFAACAAAVLV